MLGTFLPWASAGGLFSIDGTRGDGWITLFFFAACAAVGASGIRAQPMTAGRGFAVYLLAGCALAVALYDASQFARAPIPIFLGSGLYLVITTAAVVIFTASLSGPVAQPVATVLIAGAIAAAGFMHVAYGKEQAVKMCKKEQWSLVDTFVDVDGYIGKSTATAPPNVTKALLACGALTLITPETTSEVPTSTEETLPTSPFVGVRCSVPNATEFHGRTANGQCADLDNCGAGFVYYTGFCKGPASIVCCVREP
jgi:hypothetical protein